MNPKAVEKARERLRLASDKLEEAAAAPNYAAFCGAWYFFLTAAKNVYTTLEQGAKDSPQSRQWFGAKKNERKSDPLLQYLFQARDDNEHGLSDVTKLEPASMAIGRIKPGYSNAMTLNVTTDDRGKPTIHKAVSHDGLPILVESKSSHAALVPVTGRGNITYNPPKSHLGSPLPDDLPVTVGRLGLAYLELLVADASRLA
jgi:hypothetical protein